MGCRNISKLDYLVCDPEFSESYHLNSSKIVASIFIVIIMLLCIIGNLVMIYLFYRYRRLRIVPNYFIISLAVSDLLVGFIAMPLWISIELIGWGNFPPHIDIDLIYRAVMLTDIFCCVSSIVNLTAVSLERFFGVYKPLKHRSLMNAKTAIFFIIMFWCYSLLLTMLQLAPTLVPNYLIIVFIMGFIVPLFIVYLSYLGIYFAVQSRRRRRRASCSSNNNELSITKSLFIVTVVFTICWIPFFIYALLFRYCISCDFVDTSHFNRFEKFAKWLHYCNSALNPIIYGVCNVNFRSSFRDLFKCCFRRRGREYSKSNWESETQDMRSSFLRRSTMERSHTINSEGSDNRQPLEYKHSNGIDEDINLLEYSSPMVETLITTTAEDHEKADIEKRIEFQSTIHNDVLSNSSENNKSTNYQPVLSNGHPPSGKVFNHSLVNKGTDIKKQNGEPLRFSNGNRPSDNDPENGARESDFQARLLHSQESQL